jgi:hypothetical protein
VTPTRPPRDAQRRRLYLAETPLPGRKLPSLDDCAAFADTVVGSLWWELRFPDLTLAGVPRMRPGYGARQAFYCELPDGPAITLPRRYRTTGVVLHELCHWALARDDDLPAHGRTFARLLLDATEEFGGASRADALAESYRAQRVHVSAPPRLGPDGRLRYGWDERLRLGRGRLFDVHWHDRDSSGTACIRARFDGWGRNGSTVRLRAADETVVVTASSVWDVRAVRDPAVSSSR